MEYTFLKCSPNVLISLVSVVMSCGFPLNYSLICFLQVSWRVLFFSLVLLPVLCLVFSLWTWSTILHSLAGEEVSSLSTTFTRICLFYYSHSEGNEVIACYGFDFLPHLLFPFNWVVFLSLWELVMLHQPRHFLDCYLYSDCLHHAMSCQWNKIFFCHCPHFLPLSFLAWLHFCLFESFFFIQTDSSVLWETSSA